MVVWNGGIYYSLENANKFGFKENQTIDYVSLLFGK